MKSSEFHADLEQIYLSVSHKCVPGPFYGSCAYCREIMLDIQKPFFHWQILQMSLLTSQIELNSQKINSPGIDIYLGKQDECC